jgi:hypothetical protein
MSEDPVDLDGHRSPEGRLETAFRRGTQRAKPCDQTDSAPQDTALHGQLMARPADSWAEVSAKVDFLLGLLALTAEGQDTRVRKLARRALSDIARLARREEQTR